MNLVDGVTTFPVLVGSDVSLTRSEDVAHRMAVVGRGDLAVVLARNLSITRSIRAMDALLLMLRVREVRNFEWWEHWWRQKRFPRRIRVRKDHNRTVSECR